MGREVPVPSRKTPRQPRARATVDAIVLAAAHILRTEGRDAVNTNRIARVAGVSIGSVYQYFPNKEGILAELRARHRDWFEAETRAGIERGAQLPLREGVRASIARMVELQTLDPALQRSVSDTPSPLPPADFAQFRERTAAYLRANADRLRPVDPELAAVIITRATEALVHGLARDEPEWLRHPDFVDEVVDLVVGYLARRGESTT